MDAIVNRVAALEEELGNIKALIEDEQPIGRSLQSIRRLAKFLLSYWLLLSLAAAVGTAVYAKYAFDIDYFEEYRDRFATKKLSEMYRQLGDRMLARAEWDAAVSAYREALKINSHNTEAAGGLVKALVFVPDTMDKYAPEVIDVKLQFLEELFPHDFVVPYLRGFRSMQMQDYDAARQALEQSIARNPDFAGGHVQLGYLKIIVSDLRGAIESFGKALKLDPQSSIALLDVGYMEFLAGHFEDSLEHLRRSLKLSPRFATAIIMGDVYRHMGEAKRALQMHNGALQVFETLPPGYERYHGGEYVLNFLPLAANDAKTIKLNIFIRTRDEKLAIGHFSLALDYAAVGSTSEANSEFEKALSLDHQSAYREFYANRIDFMQNFSKLDDLTKKWLAEQRAKLLPN